METPTQTHYRPTLRGVLFTKFLRWVDKTTARQLCKVTMRFALLFVLIAGVIAPELVIAVAIAAAREPKVVAVASVVVIFFYGKSLLRLRRKSAHKKASNQHTFMGVPVTELATYLLDTGGFKNEAIGKLGLAQKQWAKIAKALDTAGIVYKSAEHNNARVLRDITREQLITQLRDDFPLVYSPTKQEWITRDGPWRTWLGDEEKAAVQRKLDVKKLEHKKKRLQKEVRELNQAPGFTYRPVAIV